MKGIDGVERLEDFFSKPVVVSRLAQAKWFAFMDAVPAELEIYSFLLCRNDTPWRIDNCYLPAQTVSGGHCRVSADVRHAGSVARRAGMRLAGSIHRHPFRSTSLSSIDDDLLEFMARELGSEVAVAVRACRKPTDLVVRETGPDNSTSSESEQRELSFVGRCVEVEETVFASRVFCLMWSPDGYFGKAAEIVYDFSAGRRQTVQSIDSRIVLEEGVHTLHLNTARINDLAQRIVRRSYPMTAHSYREADWLHCKYWQGG